VSIRLFTVLATCISLTSCGDAPDVPIPLPGKDVFGTTCTISNKGQSIRTDDLEKIKSIQFLCAELANRSVRDPGGFAGKPTMRITIDRDQIRLYQIDYFQDGKSVLINKGAIVSYKDGKAFLDKIWDIANGKTSSE
jgi:hypothetical protein